MVYLIHIVSSFLCLLLFYYYMHCLFTLRISRKLAIIIYLILSIVKIVIAIQINPFLNMIVSIFIYVLLSLLYEERCIYKGMTIILFYAISMMSENLSYILIKVALPLSLVDLWQMQMISILGIILSRIIHLLFIKIVISLLEGINKGHFSKRDFLYFMLLPVSSILIIFSLFTWIDEATSINFVLLLGTSGMLLANVAICNIYNKNMGIVKLKKQLQSAKARERADQLYYQQFKEREEVVKRYHHEMKHNYQLLHHAMLNQQYEKVNEYIEAMNIDKIDEMSFITGNYLLDVALSYQMVKINQFNIHLTYEIERVDLSDINDIDLNIIYDNLLDNAITSCIASNDKNLHLIIRRKQSLRIIKFINSCDAILVENGQFISMKKEGDHGYGLKNIQSIANQYHGQTIFKYDENQNEFESTIIFPED